VKSHFRIRRRAFVGGTVAAALLPAVVRAESPAEALLGELVAALNSHDAERLRIFASAHASSDVPVETRAERLMSLAAHGPFTLIRFENQTEPRTLRATVRDGQNALTLWTLELDESSPPRLARLGIEVRPDADLPPVRWNSLSELIAAIRHDDGAPAMTAALFRNGNVERAVDGLRTLGGVPAGFDDPWKVGSIGKPLCSSVIARLIERGTLGWDGTLGELLSDVPMLPSYKPVTLEQLMQHRAGVPEDGGFERADVERIVAGATEPLTIRLNYARDILSRTPIGSPGRQFAYSNAGYTLLGVVAERHARLAYEALLHEHVFIPLGLSTSYVHGDTLPPHPSGHAREPNGLRAMTFAGPLETMFAPAGGSIWMSAADLVSFGVAHANGLRGKDGFLRAETVARLHRGLPEGPGSRLYACGWGISRVDGVAELMHGHNGSDGTFRAELGIFPQAAVVVAAITNAGGEGVPSPSYRAVAEAARRFARA
jgi:CubicO group peptidase (beta-lactamase class C family)